MNFVEESENATINEFGRVLVFCEDSLSFSTSSCTELNDDEMEYARYRRVDNNPILYSTGMNEWKFV